MSLTDYPPGFQDMLEFPLVQALLGRRSRRFLRGATIPDGPLAYQSRHAPMPLSELERMLVLTAMGGNTGWHFMISHNARYAPHLPNYSAGAGGRTFPSPAGFQITEFFFTDDTGVYFFATRDAPAMVPKTPNEPTDLAALAEAHRQRIRKLADKRLYLPPQDPHLEGHNTWVVNQPGSLLVFPVADLAQHNIAGLCYYLQNGYCLHDDIHGTPIPGLERFRHLYDPDNPLPLSFFERYSMLESTAEIVSACYAGVLTLQAMGLGGWMFNGINPYSILGASGDPNVPGLGFRYDWAQGRSLPNPTGLPGVLEAYCPPHYADMRAAVEAFVQRKYRPGGPFHADTPGPWKESAKVRSSAEVHSEEFKECVTVQAQYIYDRFGKFPGTVPSVLMFMYLQAHHLDLDFYDHHFEPGAYLPTHAQHMERWHPGEAP